MQWPRCSREWHMQSANELACSQLKWTRCKKLMENFMVTLFFWSGISQLKLCWRIVHCKKLKVEAVKTDMMLHGCLWTKTSYGQGYYVAWYGFFKRTAKIIVSFLICVLAIEVASKHKACFPPDLRKQLVLSIQITRCLSIYLKVVNEL